MRRYDRENPPICNTEVAIGETVLEMRVGPAQALAMLNGETVFPASAVIIRDLDGAPLTREQLHGMLQHVLHVSTATVLTRCHRESVATKPANIKNFRKRDKAINAEWCTR